MPWHIESDNPDCAGFAVVKDGTGEVVGCHETEADAQAHMAALYANEPEMQMSIPLTTVSTTPGSITWTYNVSTDPAAVRAADPNRQGRRQERAAMYADRSVLPGGEWRGRDERGLPIDWPRFPAQIRSSATLVEYNGQKRFQLDGYASVVERGYEMWDFAGPYTEIVAKGAFDKTMAAEPDVVFLVNHAGIPMARTTNGSLQLAADSLGLRSTAFLNPQRQDVNDLVVAVGDRDVTEMSFAFRIVDAHWSEDYDTFYIDQVDLERGDVSGVTYGASPHTSIAARAHDILESMNHLPAAVARAAMERLQARADLVQQPLAASQNGESVPASQNGTAEERTQPEMVGQSEPASTGRSVFLARKQLLLETE